MSEVACDDDRQMLVECHSMLMRWSKELIVFLDAKDHDDYATRLALAGLIQMARSLLADNDPELREQCVRVLSTEGVLPVVFDTQ